MNRLLPLNIRFLKGDTDAFNEVFQEAAPRLLGFARSYLKSHEAEDIVQEVFLTIWQKRDNFPPDSNVLKLLFAATRNKCIDLLRHKQQIAKFTDYKIALDLNALEHSKLDSPDYKSLEKVIMVAINSLPPKIKEVFIMSRFHGKTYTQIAQELDVSVKAVEKRMSTALSLLRRALGETLLALLLI